MFLSGKNPVRPLIAVITTFLLVALTLHGLARSFSKPNIIDSARTLQTQPHVRYTPAPSKRQNCMMLTQSQSM